MSLAEVFFFSFFCFFLDAFSHLYRRVCPSVRRSVGPSVTHELKSCESAVFNQNYWQYERERILCRVYGLVKIQIVEIYYLVVPTRENGVYENAIGV